jgi:hypothetical protein
MRAHVTLAFGIVAAAALLVGCGAVEERPLANDHPANPEAAEAPLPPRSKTLDLASADPFPTAPAREPEVPYAGHAPAHGAHGHEAPAATTPTASGAAGAAAVYTCPMDPEVISDKPGRCPKCGMQLELAKPGEKP